MAFSVGEKNCLTGVAKLATVVAMTNQGWPDHSGRPEDYDDDRPDEPRCEGMVHIAGRLVDCWSTDDIVPWTDAHGIDHRLCVPCTAMAKEEEERERDADFDRMLMAIPPAEEATPEPVLDEELTEKIPEETMAELVVNGGK